MAQHDTAVKEAHVGKSLSLGEFHLIYYHKTNF